MDIPDVWGIDDSNKKEAPEIAKLVRKELKHFYPKLVFKVVTQRSEYVSYATVKVFLENPGFNPISVVVADKKYPSTYNGVYSEEAERLLEELSVLLRKFQTDNTRISIVYPGNRVSKWEKDIAKFGEKITSNEEKLDIFMMIGRYLNVNPNNYNVYVNPRVRIAINRGIRPIDMLPDYDLSLNY